MSKNELVAVLGAGNMGTSIAQIVALNGYKVNLWNYSGDLEPLEQIKAKRENIKYLPGIELSNNINSETDIAKATANAEVIFMAVPSDFIQSVAKQVFKYISSKAICIDVSKGLDGKSVRLITDILSDILPKNKIATVSGPAIAKQMVKGNFTVMNVASRDALAVKKIKKIMESKNLKLVSSDDVAGVEIAGSLKNVYAIAIGICDGLEISTNTKAVLFVVALREMGLVVQKMGGRMETVYGLAGLGDLLGTGLALSSRNRRLGEFLAQGLSVEKAAAKVGQVVEGVSAARTLYKLSKKYNLSTPLGHMVYKIVCINMDPKIAMENFLSKLK